MNQQENINQSRDNRGRYHSDDKKVYQMRLTVQERHLIENKNQVKWILEILEEIKLNITDTNKHKPNINTLSNTEYRKIIDYFDKRVNEISQKLKSLFLLQ